MEVKLTILQSQYLETLVSGEIARLEADSDLPCLVRVELESFREILAAIGAAKIKCGRCGREVDEQEAEICWYCRAYLCPGCWDEYGHCGHPEADAFNERVRAVPQPERKEAGDAVEH